MTRGWVAGEEEERVKGSRWGRVGGWGQQIHQAQCCPTFHQGPSRIRDSQTDRQITREKDIQIKIRVPLTEVF
jgi:hypothetical protein